MRVFPAGEGLNQPLRSTSFASTVSASSARVVRCHQPVEVEVRAPLATLDDVVDLEGPSGRTELTSHSGLAGLAHPLSLAPTARSPQPGRDGQRRRADGLEQVVSGGRHEAPSHT